MTNFIKDEVRLLKLIAIDYGIVTTRIQSVVSLWHNYSGSQDAKYIFIPFALLW